MRHLGETKAPRRVRHRRIGTWSEVITGRTEVTFLHGGGKRGTPLAYGTSAVNPDWLAVKGGTINLFLSACLQGIWPI